MSSCRRERFYEVSNPLEMVAVVECRFEPSSSTGQARLWDRRNLPGSGKGLLASKYFHKHLIREQFIH
ncbi:Uncharacterized protein FKW44_003043 [Caligus rogercresseyi]|uniref:Uncharacterized protein n=1 Tax=Caligus rogercresseyi TaxID=217165 RepID=A0A7T8KL31_CALRO|nr:Uncharacterized protein FKW44_003043 [Caligus rogercresseyi]